MEFSFLGKQKKASEVEKEVLFVLYVGDVLLHRLTLKMNLIHAAGLSPNPFSRSCHVTFSLSSFTCDYDYDYFHYMPA